MRIPKTHTLVERSYFYYIISKNHELEKENKRLQERNEKLEKMAFQYTPEEWNTMLRTIERLQEQLKEANEVIDACCSLQETHWVAIDSYRDKWGVK